jgi:small conductance mechanosensitive channel
VVFLALAIAAGMTGTAAAQEAPAEAPQEAPAEATAPEAAEGEVADEAVEEAADAAAPDPEAADEAESPAIAEGLADPDIPREELELRLIPLTGAEHEELAEAWLAIVRAMTEAVVEQQLIIRGDDADAAEEARLRLTELNEERRGLFDKYSVVLNSWEAKGGDPDVIAGYRAYRAAILVDEARQADWRTLVAQATAWATNPEGGVALAINLGIIVAAFLGLLIVARIVRSFARRWINRIPNISRLLQAFLALVVYWLTIAFGLMIVLSALGVNITPLFALVGGASFIIAFAMQDTLSNLAAGLMIMINHPFDEGDSVDIGGVSGTVRSVSVVSTTVVTPENEVIVVPNSKVWGNVIRNATVTDTRRVDLVFGVARKESIEAAQGVLEATVKAHPLILPAPAPTVRVSELTDGAVKFIVQPWSRSADTGQVQSDLLRQVKENFEAAGIAAA